MGLEQPRGALIAQVLKDSPAMAAGLKRGDVIVAYDNRPIRDSQQLPLMVGETPVGHKVMVKFIRNHATRQVTVTITPSREEEVEKTVAAQEEAPPIGGAALGLDVENITPQLARELGMSDKDGVVITQVQAGSSADGAGLRRRDIILEVDRQPVKDVHSYEQALAKRRADSVLLLIKRAGSTLFVPLKRQG
jgi:serine protease Do